MLTDRFFQDMPWTTLGAGLAILLLAVCATGASPEEFRSREGPGRERKSAAEPKGAGRQIRARNRERWEKLNPQEREKLREIYRQLEKLPPGDRRRLLERLREMKDSERRQAIEYARERLRRQADPRRPTGPPDRGKKDAGRPHRKKSRTESPPDAPPAKIGAGQKRQRSPEQIKAMEKRLKKTMDNWLQQLPAQVRERVSLFTRQEQVELFRNYRTSELLLRAVPDRSEREQLLDLTPLQLRLLHRPDAGKPDGLSPESWKRWQSLKVMERRLVVLRLQKLKKDRSDAPSLFFRKSPASRGQQRSQK